MRTCRYCHKPKPLTEFGINNFLPDKIALYCKACNRLKKAESKERARYLLLNTRVRVSLSLLGMK